MNEGFLKFLYTFFVTEFKYNYIKKGFRDFVEIHLYENFHYERFCENHIEA